jgi:hypothetical protein
MRHLAGDFEPCDTYRAPIEHDEPVCRDCGHLSDEHHVAGATVTALRSRHPSSFRPARKAS